MQTIERSIDIDAPLDAVFVFLTDIRNHTRLSPPHIQEELIDPGDIPLKLDTTVYLRGKYGGVYLTVKTGDLRIEIDTEEIQYAV